jgi:hypothetical protein
MARQIAAMSKNRILALVLCLASSPIAAHAVWLRCIASGRECANAHFSRSWMAMVRRLGWQTVLIITPDLWLADADTLDGPVSGGK